jgi:hypothetical protein
MVGADAAPGVAGVAAGQPGRVGLQPVLLALPVVAGRPGPAGHSARYTRAGRLLDDLAIGRHRAAGQKQTLVSLRRTR